jgi:hypothetical protein
MFSLKTHNILDYVAGVFLILAPFLFGFGDLEVARSAVMMSGFALILYSLFTNYYYSLMRVIPLGVHMALDAANGVFLITAPWIFQYRAFLTPTQEYLHYVLGIGVLGLVAVTREKTEVERRSHGISLNNPSAAAPRI